MLTFGPNVGSRLVVDQVAFRRFLESGCCAFVSAAVDVGSEERRSLYGTLSVGQLEFRFPRWGSAV
jgi:hypothetical protein